MHSVRYDITNCVFLTFLSIFFGVLTVFFFKKTTWLNFTDPIQSWHPLAVPDASLIWKRWLGGQLLGWHVSISVSTQGALPFKWYLSCVTWETCMAQRIDSLGVVLPHLPVIMKLVFLSCMTCLQLTKIDENWLRLTKNAKIDRVR